MGVFVGSAFFINQSGLSLIPPHHWLHPESCYWINEVLSTSLKFLVHLIFFFQLHWPCGSGCCNLCSRLQPQLSSLCHFSTNWYLLPTFSPEKPPLKKFDNPISLLKIHQLPLTLYRIKVWFLKILTIAFSSNFPSRLHMPHPVSRSLQFVKFSELTGPSPSWIFEQLLPCYPANSDSSFTMEALKLLIFSSKVERNVFLQYISAI